MHIAYAQENFLLDGYSLRRTGPAKWAYFDIEDVNDDGSPRLVCEGESPADAARKLIEERYS